MKQITVLAIAAVLIAGYAGIAAAEQCLLEAIAFSSTRDNPTGNPFLTAEIYLMDTDGTNPRRLTDNNSGEAFAKPSPDGRKIVFDSNRLRAEGEPINTSDLFVMKMNTDGTEQIFLTRGSSATWSPDSKYIAFHASASGTGLPINGDVGAATTDSDIFVMNVDDLLENGTPPKNITNSPLTVDNDPDWSPDGQKIVFTRHPIGYPALAEMYVINADGTGAAQQLTFNGEEPRAPAWSPDGTRISYGCRRGGFDYEICVLNLADDTDIQLTDNIVLDGTHSWSPNGQKIVFHRTVVSQRPQIWVMNADGTGETQLTTTPGINLFPAWGVVRVQCAHGN